MNTTIPNATVIDDNGVLKVVRDGKVAVLYSPGFGAGWSTEASEYKNLALFHPRFVEMVAGGDPTSEAADAIVADLLGTGEDVYFCTAGAYDLEIKWIDRGEAFLITEYDGSEGIQLRSGDYWTVA